MKNQLLQGDALTILPTLEANSFDALITDPPYASGGLTAAARARPPSTKYCRMAGTPTSLATNETNART
ncbi:DNA modification methylase [Xanthomonas campestris]|nr:DNA modification methylase [Xanthomonas sp. CFBP 8151]